jgi:hypothetical protein
MKKALTTVLVVALVTLFGGTLWYLWRKAQKPVVVYDTESPAVADIVKKTVATGSVIPRKEVAVKPQVSGIIESIRVEPGEDVKRGDLLASSPTRNSGRRRSLRTPPKKSSRPPRTAWKSSGAAWRPARETPRTPRSSRPSTARFSTSR